MNERIGPTGEFPDGKMNEHDEGELKMALAVDAKNKVVVMDFGKPVAWIGLPKQMALDFAKGLTEKANQLPD